jgi:hypothetical protein
MRTSLGGESNAANALQQAVQAQGLSDGLIYTQVEVGGQVVTVTGRVINGVFNIGTAYIPPYIP